MEVIMHAGMTENAARIRVAELPEPVKNQRSQPGLPCRAQFFAGSADVSIRGFAASALGGRPSRWRSTFSKGKFVMRASITDENAMTENL